MSGRIGGPRPAPAKPAATPAPDPATHIVADEVAAMLAAAEAAGILAGDPMAGFVRAQAALIGSHAEAMGKLQREMTAAIATLGASMADAKERGDREIEVARAKIAAMPADPADRGWRVALYVLCVLGIAIGAGVVGYVTGESECHRSGATRLDASTGRSYCTVWLD